MLSFFKRKGGKAEATPGIAEATRKHPSEIQQKPSPVEPNSSLNDNDVTNEKSNTFRKDVVNLLIPETNYNQKTGVGALLEIMAGKRKKNRKKTERTESCRESPQKEMHNTNLQRSKSDLESKHKRDDDAAPTTEYKNTLDAPNAATDPADFVKALVLEKYANKSPVEAKQQHVSLVYVSNEPDLEEKRHAEALLREIARSIDCTIDQINAKESMGTTESKTDKQKKQYEPIYETIEDSNIINNNETDSSRNNVQNNSPNELDNKESDAFVESPAFKKKSNLKPPKSDGEAYSDDDRSDCGKKRVTFRKHIVFDDGDQQTDEEVDSSFESFSSEEEEEIYLEDALPDNDELLGGVVVSRNDTENKMVISVTENNEITNDPIKIRVECVDDELKRISSDNSDSGFLEISKKHSCELKNDVKTLYVEESSASELSESGSETEEEVIEEIEEEVEEELEEEEESIIDIIELNEEDKDDKKTLVTQESKFQSQVAALTELADTRCGEAEKARELIATYRKEIEEKNKEIEQLKCELAAAYKESELVRQRSRSLEEELAAARSCSADLADQLQKRNDESLRQLKAELEDALTRRAELESRVLALEQEKDRLHQERALQEERAQEALTAAEADTAKWRAAHEAARSQAAARAERMLSDCEWKMRELEKRARDTDKLNAQLTETVEKLKSNPTPSPAQLAELQQLRGLATEQQHSVQAMALQLQQVETREEALKLEVHRLKELLEKEARIGREKEERYVQTIGKLEQQHKSSIDKLKSEHATSAANTRATLERSYAERTRAALQQLRAEAEQENKNSERKLREITTRYETLKEELANKEAYFEKAITEAHCKADWDIMQLRHLLDKTDINFANTVEQMTEKFEKEKEQIIAEWTDKVRLVEEQATSAADDARRLLETTRSKLLADKVEQVNKLKEQHKKEMDEQWEQFMTDKENCLARMKTECRQEGEEERIKRERELLAEIKELKSQVQCKTKDFDNLAVKAAACGRTLAVTEQELREAMARERELREKRGEDTAKLKQLEKASNEKIEHLTRKCACIRKLFDDMRTRLAARERTAEQEAKAKDKELHQLRAEVARLTKILIEQKSPKLGARTRADGCETLQSSDETVFSAAECVVNDMSAPRRKGGSLKTPEFLRKRANLPDLAPLPPEVRRMSFDFPNGRRRANSVDLPAVQVPVRIKQLEEKTKD